MTKKNTIYTALVIIVCMAFVLGSCDGGGGGGGDSDDPVCKDKDGDGRGKYCKLGKDCDDSNPNAWDTCATCIDGDTDGWFLACNEYTTVSGPDCDDIDPDNWTSCLACVDLDGDSQYTACDDYSILVGPDCDDGDSAVYMGAPEICDNQDNQCPGDAGFGQTDEGVKNTYYLDIDGDGYGDLLSSFEDCTAPIGFVGNSVDCDDLDIDNWISCLTCLDGDTDGWFSGCDAYATRNGPDCNDDRPDVYPGAVELCDGIDNQCPGDPFYGSIDVGCMAEIPAGCFYMGDSYDSCTIANTLDECPVHIVCLDSDFFMDQTEVTNEQYKLCVDDGACSAPGTSSSFTRPSYYGNPVFNNYPVVAVSWFQASDFCAWAGKRLPTEAEREYAGRGGLSGKRFPWGDTISCAQANYFGCVGDTSEAGSYPANGYGLYDVSGNVWEWTGDWYSDTYYQNCLDNLIVVNPLGPLTGQWHPTRGGSISDNWTHLRAATRGGNNTQPTIQHYNTGFRCAVGP